jgi:hypothetical protein
MRGEDFKITLRKFFEGGIVWPRRGRKKELALPTQSQRGAAYHR